MRIGELAERSGVSVRSLRYYEQQGLLSSTRTEGGQRRYEEGAIDRVIRIQELFAAGLSSKRIAVVLPCIEARAENRTPALLDELAVERQRINAQITDLLRTRDTLDEVISTAADVLTASQPA
ncbi:DNA-binding transcriptional MerR regulator [Promicromonospora sp. AC04]|uniref:MerR family transcriptional regulator n=1 Tax=Promicromonospora sp. AC04 TaxID=2135723 RepID=UPI000D3D4398|nr:MerR family transcriptional regulator [Promicromonospora sp. AC04]PUB20809.1 DNA-binding transcriptional MerR regulator [Promicromonospora sp. AC04]